ncbi:TonB-dependent receptor domain-containing protein [Thalassotalea agarivorans]|uniref:Vitamin B12 transporter n=1 Tax=Thalassotalea agarivorans TaxID=349064 RepID=A0A1I0G7J2_THASX|nr:TonB-dependent receptor [Thalassotalea agarivorans]SET66754.1 vitamin B12 transporter [Thalassotalea agarivorans]
MKKTICTLSPITLALLSGFNASAAETVEENLEVITVTGTRSELALDQQLSSVTVITREDIERIQPKSFVDLLTSLPGVDVASNGGRGQSASVFLRGANSNQTLYLLDGVRISSASLGTTDVNAIAPEIIDRIEIVRGPRAALWGSDAIGGVVQIFTRKLEENSAFAGATFGSEGYKQYKAGLGLKHGDGQSNLTVNHEQADGFDSLATAEPDKDGYEYTSFAFNGKQQLSAAFSLDWLAQLDKGDNEYDNAFGGNNQTEIDNHVYSLGANFDTQSTTTRVSIAQSQNSSTQYGSGADTLFETTRNQVSALFNARPTSAFQYNVGGDFYIEELAGTTDYATDSRNVIGVFGHGIYNGDLFAFEAAARYDDVEGIDSEVTYNAGVGINFGESTRISFNHGTGFKAPTFNDLYYPASPYSSGNPDLVSETSSSYEILLTSQLGKFDLNLSVYTTDVENLIQWQPDENFFYQPQNVAEAELKGAEFVAQYNGNFGSHTFNATYGSAVDAQTDKDLLRRADYQFNYLFGIDIGELGLYMEYQYVGKRYDSGFDENFAPIDIKLDAYSLLNLSARYPVGDYVELEARITNATDEEYQTVNNYNTQGRAAYLGVVFKL